MEKLRMGNVHAGNETAKRDKHNRTISVPLDQPAAPEAQRTNTTAQTTSPAGKMIVAKKKRARGSTPRSAREPAFATLGQLTLRRGFVLFFFTLFFLFLILNFRILNFLILNLP
jgi:hypothetical protein